MTPTSSTWLQVKVATSPDRAGVIEEALNGAGALSVTLEDAGEMPLLEPEPGTMPLWHATRLIALFDGGADRGRIRDALADVAEGGAATPEFESLADRDWTRVWMDDWEPLRFGRRLWVAPLEAEIEEAGAVIARLDPGMAFGTGTHPSTALCLEWLDGLALTGERVLDYGCGSGILAIAALLLGAQSAHAIDIDPQALEATRANAATNGVLAAVTTGEPEELAGDGFGAVVANILAGPLVQAAGTLAACQPVGGRIALAGILAEQAEDVRAAYAPWYDLALTSEREEWILLTGVKRRDD